MPLESKMAEVQETMREIGRKERVETGPLREAIRRMLVLMLADAPTPFEMRETIKMLSEMEGYRKAPVKAEGVEDGGATDAELEKMGGKL